MKGIPGLLNTKQDWLNAHHYALAQGNSGYKSVLKGRLEALKNTAAVLVLKEGVTAEPEDQTADDFEAVEDQASAFVRTGLSTAEIDLMISQLG